MKVAVIIPVLAGKTDEYARVCIKSLRATTDWDIIVVSNGSAVKPDFSGLGVTLHLHTRDQGQCNAVNIGAKAAGQVDYLLISNDDMYYAPGWTKFLKFDHLVFSPNLIEPINNLGSAPPFQKWAYNGFTLDEFDRELYDAWYKDYFLNDNNIADADRGTEPGFNLPFFIRKDVFDTIGGYDVNYDPWGSNSDTDIQTAINLAGITPMRVRDVLVYHFSTKSGTFDNSHQDFYRNNFEYFRDKFGFDRDQLGSDVWYNKDMLPADKSIIKFKPTWAGKYA